MKSEHTNAIELKNIGKSFPLRRQMRARLGSNSNLLSEFPANSELRALRDITLRVGNGEIIGLIGRNGSGKTTLLKVIAGIITPTYGTLAVNGRLAGIFNLGAGFQNELSGRENIYLNARILGISYRTITEKYAEIVSFSELGEFIGLPLGQYSSGMRMRLGFSIALYADCDILLLDETLLVGDIKFQEKCFNALRGYKEQGKTMVLTTQSLSVIEKLCSRAYLLEAGRIVFEGAAGAACERYRRLLNEQEFERRRQGEYITQTKRWAEDMKEWGTQVTTECAAIESLRTYNRWGRQTNQFKSNDTLRIRIDFMVHRPLCDIHFGIALFREDGVYCYGPNTRWDGHRIDLHPGSGWLDFKCENLFLAPGRYYISAVIWEKNEEFPYSYHRCRHFIEIAGSNRYEELLKLPHRWPSFIWRPAGTNGSLSGIRQLLDREKQYCENGIKIKEVTFFDSRKIKIQEFMTGRQMDIRVSFECNGESARRNKMLLWIGIFRSDGIYCQGFLREVASSLPEVTVAQAPLRLLPGEYVVSVGLWGLKDPALCCWHHKAYPFKVVSNKCDHGTVYLPHLWRWRLPQGASNE